MTLALLGIHRVRPEKKAQRRSEATTDKSSKEGSVPKFKGDRPLTTGQGSAWLRSAVGNFVSYRQQLEKEKLRRQVPVFVIDVD